MFEHFVLAASVEILVHLLGFVVVTIEKPGTKYNWDYPKIGILSIALSYAFFVGLNPCWPTESALMWGLGFSKFTRLGIRYIRAKLLMF